MGFRSTLTTQFYGYDLPDWFKDKYTDYYYINGTLVSSLCELKHYNDEFETDYQKALIECGFFDKIKSMVCAVLAEDGVITKVFISKDDIEYIHFFNDCLVESFHKWTN